MSICLSVCLSVCVLVTSRSPAKQLNRSRCRSGLTRMGLSNHAFDGIETFQGERTIFGSCLAHSKASGVAVCRTQPAFVDGFQRSIRHLTCFRARECLLAVALILLLYGMYSPKKPLGAWVDIFRPNAQNNKTGILWKLLRRSHVSCVNFGAKKPIQTNPAYQKV